MKHYVGDGCELLDPRHARSVAHAVALRQQYDTLGRQIEQLRGAVDEAEQRALRGREPSEGIQTYDPVRRSWADYRARIRRSLTRR